MVVPVSVRASTPVPRLTSISAPSSSVTATVSGTAATAAYSSELLAAATAWVRVTVACAAFASCTAVTVSTWPVFQVVPLKVRVCVAPAVPPVGVSVTAGSSLVTWTFTVPAAGGAVRCTV